MVLLAKNMGEKMLDIEKVLAAKILEGKNAFYGVANVVDSRMLGGKVSSVAECLSGNMLLVAECQMVKSRRYCLYQGS